MSAARIAVVDSHTGGEPTRLVIGGAPSLHGTLAERVHQLRDRHDRFRCAVVNEPRGSDVLVGALLTPPADQTCVAGAIFFNNVGYLGMCGHGTIGLMVTLAWLGRIVPGEHRVETPVGRVVTHLHDAHAVSVRNVPAYRFAHAVSVHVEGHGFVKGDVAWGGNWFFLTDQHGQRLALDNAGRLADFTLRVRAALTREGICGAAGAEIDHIELFDASPRPGVDSRNFVMCPGGAFDRSPCGTGTSAKLACLYADGKLRPGENWRQESITGSVFEGRFELVDGQVLPTIRGSAWVTGEGALLLDPDDPHCWGVRA